MLIPIAKGSFNPINESQMMVAICFKVYNIDMIKSYTL